MSLSKTTVNITFTFEGRVPDAAQRKPAAQFPFGGLGVKEITIAPIDLRGLDAATAEAAIAKQVTALAQVTQCLSLASVQLEEAIADR